MPLQQSLFPSSRIPFSKSVAVGKMARRAPRRISVVYTRRALRSPGLGIMPQRILPHGRTAIVAGGLGLHPGPDLKLQRHKELRLAVGDRPPMMSSIDDKFRMLIPPTDENSLPTDETPTVKAGRQHVPAASAKPPTILALELLSCFHSSRH